MKRTSPSKQEIEKFAKYLLREYGDHIRDNKTFLKAYDEYFSEQGWLKAKWIKQDVFDEVRKARPDVSDKDLFKEAKGKDFDRDKSKKARRVVTSEKEYRRLGARNVDLAGYDTPDKFVFVGKQKGAVKYARVINTKAGVRYIDKRGRYVSIKKKG